MKLSPGRLKEAEFTRKIYEVTAEIGTTADDLLKPDFWVHVSARMKARERVEVHAQDGTWCADLIVRSASRVGAVMALLAFHDFAAAKSNDAELDDYEIKHRGPRKWSAIRKTDKMIVVEDKDTREAVVDWLRNPAQHQLAA